MTRVSLLLLCSVLNICLSIVIMLVIVLSEGSNRVENNTLKEVFDEIRKFKDIEIDVNCNYNIDDIEWLWK